MRAIEITDDHQLRLAELPEPTPGPGDVLVDVTAAGVNAADLAQAAGHYPPPPGASPLPGLEVSGHRRDTGEPVVALLAGGGYAETVAVTAGQVLPAPPALSLVDAAGLIEAAATVVSNLVIEAGLRVPAEARAGLAASGIRLPATDPRPEALWGEQEDAEAAQTVLIHGGTGGVGSFAVQFARAMGARVLATVGADASIAAARALGAHEVWNRRTTDVPETVRTLGGADIVLDVAGGPTLDDNVRLLREFGRLVIISTAAGPRGELHAGRLMTKRARIIGTTVRSRTPDDKQRILAVTRALVWPLLERGEIRVPVHARFPLAEAAAAHEVLRAGGHVGKVLLEVA